jgi:GxxExxY protein
MSSAISLPCWKRKDTNYTKVPTRITQIVTNAEPSEIDWRKFVQPLSGHPNLGVNSCNSCLNPFVSELLYKEEIFQLVGLCMEIHRELGKGHDEVIYKDALVIELTRAAIPFSRERNYEITYKGAILPHCYYADSVVWDKILFEAKAVEKLTDSHVRENSCNSCPAVEFVKFVSA